MLTKPVYPRSVGTCPVCNGTKRMPYQGQHAATLAGYSKVDGTIPCQNCGGQYMSMSPTGFVWHNQQDLPCTHHYAVTETKNCLHTYRCIHCGDTYQIDSGD